MADIGATLREARMRAKIDINEVEASTKIRAKYLRALENEEWDLLPGDVYARSFVRSYASYLGLDSRPLLDELRRQRDGPVDHEVRPISPRNRDRDRGHEHRRRGPLVPPWALVGMVLAAVVVLLYIVGIHNSPKKTTGVQTGQRSGQAHHPAHVRHHSSPLLHVASKPRSVSLQLTPTARVWVCLVDGTGHQLIPGQIFDAGQTIPTVHSTKLLLTLGNAGVQIKVNGKPMTVPPSAVPIGFEFLPDSTRPLPSAQQPRCA